MMRKPVCARATSGAIDASEVAASGTQFQHDVWAARRTIRAGTTISPSALAWRLGRPKAVRAVGMANGADPIGIAVPCHCVIGAGASLTGDDGGIERTRWLLTPEGAPFKDAASPPLASIGGGGATSRTNPGAMNSVRAAGR